MRHADHNRKFGRKQDARRALMTGLALNLIERNRIRTTEAKAKELRPFIEKMLTRAKNPTLAAQRILIAQIPTQKGVTKLIKEIAPRFADRKGGYTRIIKLAPRKSDASPMAMIEFVA